MQEVKKRFLIEEREYWKNSLTDVNQKIGGIIGITNLNTDKYSNKEWKRYSEGDHVWDDRDDVLQLLMQIVDKS